MDRNRPEIALVFDTNVIAYALLGALAVTRGLKVVTYDQDVLNRFPEWTVSVPDYLASLSAS
jgi:hypothetical protein